MTRASRCPRTQGIDDGGRVPGECVFMDGHLRRINALVAMRAGQTAISTDEADRRAPILSGERARTELVLKGGLVIRILPG